MIRHTSAHSLGNHGLSKPVVARPATAVFRFPGRALPDSGALDITGFGEAEDE